MNDLSTSALGLLLSTAVPLCILDILNHGGPTDTEIEQTRAFAQVLGERGDVLLYGGRPGEAASLANQLAKAVAVMAFMPGGIRIFDQHFEAEKWRKSANTVKNQSH